MCSEEGKLDDFLNKFSNPLKAFREVCNKKRFKVRVGIENQKEESEKMTEDLVEEARQLFERNNTNFKRVEDFSGSSMKLS